MCVVSMIMDHYYDKWQPYNPYVPPYIVPGVPPYVPYVAPATPSRLPTDDEIEEFRKLLERAREYDKKNNEPDCELQEKKDKLLKLAEELGVKIDFL